MATILIIDDSKAESMLMQRVVEDLGHSAVAIHSGKAAIETADQVRPALILLDIVMPEQDGYVTCRQLKKNPATAETPVLLVSSKNGSSDKFWGLRQGASEYVTKPFTPTELAALVKRYAGPN